MVDKISPDPGGYTATVNQNLTFGYSFHLELSGLDENCDDVGVAIDSVDFEIVPSSSSAALSLITPTAIGASTPGSSATMGVSVGSPSKLSSAVVRAASSAYAQGYADAANSNVLPHSAILGLGIGLGLGIPLLVMAVAATTFWLCASKRSSRDLRTSGNGWGTQVDAGAPGTPSEK